MVDIQPGTWSAFQFLVRERLREEGVQVAPDGTLTSERLRTMRFSGRGDRPEAVEARPALVRRPDGRQLALLAIAPIRR